MKRVGILYHPKITAAGALARELEGALEASVWLCSAWEEEKAREKVAGTDLILAIGGDGTILRSARIVVPWPVPIVGINLGRLGFMSELSAKEALTKVPAFLDGEGWVDERTMLQADIASRKGVSFHALNDVMVGRGAVSRVVYIKATIDGEPLTTYRADGVLVATATGSTGYSLAVGGPILYPQAREFLLQPISAHLSLSYPLVLPPTAILELEVNTDHQAMLSIDGQVEVALKSGDRVTVKRSPHQARFLRVRPPQYFYGALVARLTSKQGGLSPSGDNR